MGQGDPKSIPKCKLDTTHFKMSEITIIDCWWECKLLRATIKLVLRLSI